MLQLRTAGIEVVPTEVTQARHLLRALVVRQQLVPTYGPPAVRNPVSTSEVGRVQWTAVAEPMIRIPTEMPRPRRIDAKSRVLTRNDSIDVPTIHLRKEAAAFE